MRQAFYLHSMPWRQIVEYLAHAMNYGAHPMDKAVFRSQVDLVLGGIEGFEGLASTRKTKPMTWIRVQAAVCASSDSATTRRLQDELLSITFVKGMVIFCAVKQWIHFEDVLKGHLLWNLKDVRLWYTDDSELLLTYHETF